MLEACRTCLQLIDKDQLTYHKIETTDEHLSHNSNRYKILTIIPEMALNISRKSIMCDPCHKSLEIAFEFKRKCLQTESMITRYIYSSQVNLEPHLTQVAIINKTGLIKMPDEPNNCAINEEGIKSYIKQEPTDTKVRQCENYAAKMITGGKTSSVFNYGRFNSWNNTPETIFKTRLSGPNKIIFSKVPRIRVEENLLKDTISEDNSGLKRGQINHKSHENLNEQWLYNNNNNNNYYNCDDDTSLRNEQTTEKNTVIPDLTTLQKKKCVQCSVCSRMFLNRWRLKNHIRTHTKETPYACNQCPKAFSDQSTLRKHLRIHAGIKNFECDICHKKFYDKGNLNKHTSSVHTRLRPYKCVECLRAFGRKEHLKKHLITHTGEKKFECHICSKRYARRSVLMIHMNIHTGVRDYPCGQCDKKFYDGSTLRKHKLHHTGEKPYKCTICQRRYSQKPHLTIHMRQHTGERPYVCSICDKRFARANARNTHLRSHTGEKPFHCDICDKMFSTRSNLWSHKKIHTGIKAFKCEDCSKSFVHKNDLKKHTMVHTKEKPFECCLCLKRFNRRSRAREHVARMHKNAMNVENCVILAKNNPQEMQIKNEVDGSDLDISEETIQGLGYVQNIDVVVKEELC